MALVIELHSDGGSKEHGTAVAAAEMAADGERARLLPIDGAVTHLHA